MNPSNNNQTAGTPAPVAGKVPVIPLPELDSGNAANLAAPGTSGQITGEQAPQIVPMTTIPLPLPKTASPTGPQVTTGVSQATALQVADDKDVIEPEWVHKANAIVNSTIDDPYKQSEDLTVLKADYMQKRYNKIVKLK
ncbi:MAG TPA: hypothetical protein VNG32_05590 [Candidatus Dormibacteraeota bacterium]|nr:hypothetical protein [Candidatus Dormibacteraeota bacterium]